MQSEFYIRLFSKLFASLQNNFKDNHDIARYGEERDAVPVSLTSRLYNSGVITKRFLNRSMYNGQMGHLHQQMEVFTPYFDRLGEMYGLLSNQSSKDLLVDLIAYRMLGKKKVKLPVNNDYYWENLQKCEAIEDKSNSIDSKFLHFTLGLFDLKPLGYDIKFHFSPSAVLIDFVLEQYRYKSAEKLITVGPGQVVIDAGGCWGDTALYFASKTGPTGKVFTYEFVPHNLEIFRKNVSLNPHLAPVINVVEHPTWDKDGIDTYFIDNGPASRVSFDRLDNYDGVAKTKTIDTLVRERNLERVDFIKMDIEGAEPYALKGAEETIRRFKPNLAIAIYHSMEDFVNIPLYIESLGLGYKLYLAHYTIHTEETVIFATTE